MALCKKCLKPEKHKTTGKCDLCGEKINYNVEITHKHNTTYTLSGNAILCIIATLIIICIIIYFLVVIL